MSIEDNKKGLFFSLEMTGEKIMEKLFCLNQNLSTHKANFGLLNEFEVSKIVKAKNKIGESNLKIFDKIFSLNQITGKIRALHLRKEVEYVVVDYLQLVKHQSSKNSNREQVISEISRTFKLLALSLKIPIILLSQLSREVEKRGDKVPMLSDLRESGSLEQDASLVQFVYRPAYGNENNSEFNENEAFLITGKNRNGKLKDVKLGYRYETSQEWYDENEIYKEEIISNENNQNNFSPNTNF
jgi:replicative DNA helicase